MSEFELIEAIAINGDKIALSAMNVVAVVFAYVVAAHFAGGQMTRIVAVFTSLVYSLFLVAPMIGCYSAIIRTVRLSARYQAQFPESNLFSLLPTELLLLISLAPMLIGWVGSIVYMHGYVRQ